MNKVIVSVCAVVIVFVALPVFAASQTAGKYDCQVCAKNGPNGVDSLPERITKLETEIAKGVKVYTAAELKLLESKLNEDNETMRILQDQ
jgi:hypothetical protein